MSLNRGASDNDDPFAGLGMQPQQLQDYNYMQTPPSMYQQQQQQPQAPQYQAAYQQPPPLMQQQQQHTTISSPAQPPTNGLFLGLTDTPPPPQRMPTTHTDSNPQDYSGGGGGGDALMTSFNNDSIGEEEEGVHHEEEVEDRELVRAQEAAMYAEEVLEGQTKTQEAQAKRGPLGFGLLPKAQTFLQNKQEKMTTAKQNMFQNKKTQSDAIGTTGFDDNTTPSWVTTDHERPPWFSSEHHKKDNNQDSQEQKEKPASQGKGAAVMGATVIGGVAGAVMLGPIAAVVAAGGAAYAAGTKDGPLGTVLRKSGGAVAHVGSAAKRVEDRTGVVKKTASGVAKGVGWIAKKATS